MPRSEIRNIKANRSSQSNKFKATVVSVIWFSALMFDFGFRFPSILRLRLYLHPPMCSTSGGGTHQALDHPLHVAGDVRHRSSQSERNEPVESNRSAGKRRGWPRRLGVRSALGLTAPARIERPPATRPVAAARPAVRLPGRFGTPGPGRTPPPDRRQRRIRPRRQSVPGARPTDRSSVRSGGGDD